MEKIKKVKKRYLAISVAALLAIISLISYLYFSQFQSTDDAFIEGTIIRISPKVSGIIDKINVEENQIVKKGDTILEIDPRDYELKAQGAKEKLELNEEDEKDFIQNNSAYKIAVKSIDVTENQLKESKENLTAISAELALAKADYKRYKIIYEEGGVSKQQLDKAETYLTGVEAKYKAALEKDKSAKAAYDMAISKKDLTEAQLKEGMTSYKKAKLDLSHTKIKAPEEGKITNKSAQEGAFAPAGVPLLSLVPPERWVIANFKETQLKNMRVGQKVNIKIDAYPNLKFKGTIESIQAATGSKTSLFPPENATGSYVKIVQRIPVKIVFDDKNSYKKYDIVPGMSVVPTVKVK